MNASSIASNFTKEILDNLLAQMSSFGPLLTVRTVPDTCRVQFRFPRTKNRRIRKKWAKDEHNFRVEETKLFPRDKGYHDTARNVLYCRESLYRRASAAATRLVQDAVSGT